MLMVMMAQVRWQVWEPWEGRLAALMYSGVVPPTIVGGVEVVTAFRLSRRRVLTVGSVAGLGGERFLCTEDLWREDWLAHARQRWKFPAGNIKRKRKTYTTSSPQTNLKTKTLKQSIRY